MMVPSEPEVARASARLEEATDPRLERIFAPEGALEQAMKARRRPFEARPEQLAMARAVARAADSGRHLLVEAGTGTGKSYAYLVPLLLWALGRKKRVLVATGTKALQQQLVERDLPFLRDLFRERLGHDFRAALCLGTANYLCPRRLAKAGVAGLFASAQESEQLQKLHSFAAKNSSGRNLDLPFDPLPGLWAQVNRESDLCLGRACPLYEDSFYWKARREQDKAQVLVANHHLLFAHIAAGGNAGGVLPPFDAIVLDEAHHAEDVAAAYLGLEFSNLSLARLIETLSNRRSGRTAFSSVNWKERPLLEERLNDAAAQTRVAVSAFFANLQEALSLNTERSSTVRIQRAGLVENALREPLEGLEKVLKDGRALAESHSEDETARELEGYAARCAQARKAIEVIIGQTESGYVYWLQCTPRPAQGFGASAGARVPRLSLHGAPVEVADALRQGVFEAFAPVILTSATLTTGGSFEFLAQRLGLLDFDLATATATTDDSAPADQGPPANRARTHASRATAPAPRVQVVQLAQIAQTAQVDESAPERAGDQALHEEDQEKEAARFDTLSLGSPFDYERNALVYVAADLPDPANQVFWEEAAVKRIAEVVKRTQGRAFVLCTSYRMVDATARFLERVLPSDIRVLRQGSGARGRLLGEFRDDVHSVLVGTTSFWQGVDVPGESLSAVVITKLPFAVPDEPLVQARIESIKRRGHDAFTQYQVPRAVMMFRQGFGRLIRTDQDRGVVAILDPRVKTKPYGAVFLESLPPCEVTTQLERLSLWMSGI